MATTTAPVARVTATDVETGETGTRDVDAGDYCLIVTEPLYIHNEHRNANGTVQITLKRRSDADV